MGYDLFAGEAHAQAADLSEREGLRAQATAAAGRRRQALGACGVVDTPALSVAGPAATLTKREREIAGLAARGLADRDIAAELVVSVRTVQTHLYNAYAKLGVGGRADLATVLDVG